MHQEAAALSPLFRSDAQGVIIALILGQPQREWSQTELVAATHSSQPTVSREMVRLTGSGLVSERRIGRNQLYRANTSHHLFTEFQRIATSTFGVSVVLGSAFANIGRVRAGILFGSWAARQAGVPGPPPADIDVLLLGSPARGSVYDAAEHAESRLALPVNVTIRPVSEWVDPDPFMREVQRRPFEVLFGDMAAIESEGQRGTSARTP